MMWELLIWTLLMFAGFAGSALYSGLETGAYSLNRIRLQIFSHERDGRALSLKAQVDDSTTLLSTLLIGNNVTNYLCTASLAVILQSYALERWQTILLNTLIVTPVLFVFGETLPKDLFSAHADRLMYRLTPVLVGSRRLFTAVGLVPLIRGFTFVVMRLIGQPSRMGAFHPRRQVESLMREGVGYGLLTDDQSAIVQRVLTLSQRTVKDEMTPWKQVVKIKAGDSSAKLWALANRSSHAPSPVVDDKGRVVGVLNIMDALVCERDATPGVDALMQPAVTAAADAAIRPTMEKLRQERAQLAVVVDASGRPAGIVTVKDLVEPITGELASW